MLLKRKRWIGKNNGPWRNRMQESIAKRKVIAMTASDDHICRDIGASIKHLVFRRVTGIAGEKDFPPAPVQSIYRHPVIRPRILRQRIRRMHDFKARTIGQTD